MKVLALDASGNQIEVEIEVGSSVPGSWYEIPSTTTIEVPEGQNMLQWGGCRIAGYRVNRGYIIELKRP